MDSIKDNIKWKVRAEIMAPLIARVIAKTGFRFSKEYRWESTVWHRLVYALVSTPTVNILADRIANPEEFRSEPVINLGSLHG
jgi:hypothetical protein